MLKLEDLIKSLVWDQLVRLALTRLFLAVPLLGWGPVGWVVSALVFKFTDLLYASVREVIDMRRIAFMNEAHRKAFDTAAIELQLVAQERGPDSAEFREAREAQQAALARFVRISV